MVGEQNKIPKTNKGITLIALVITIIVMLILVAVTISMAVNGGLFEYAGKATGETQNAINAEQDLADGKITVDGKVYNSIDEYLEVSGNKGNGENLGVGITAATMQSDLKLYLGQPVNYEVIYTDASSYGNGEWEIFYADREHIYIITKGHLADAGLTITGYNGTSDFKAESISTKYPAVGAGMLNKTYDPTSVGSELKYTSSYDNMKATQYLLDSTVWAAYANNEYAKWAIGGPTLELFVSSYNTYYPDKAVAVETPAGYGYALVLAEENSVPSGTYLNHSTDSYYWLAAPAANYEANYRYIAVRHVGGTGCGVTHGTANGSISFRPVVCLDSDVLITWDNEISKYTLSRAS